MKKNLIKGTAALLLLPLNLTAVLQAQEKKPAAPSAHSMDYEAELSEMFQRPKHTGSEAASRGSAASQPKVEPAEGRQPVITDRPFSTGSPEASIKPEEQTGETSSQPQAKKDPREELLQLELSLAEANFAAARSDENRSMLVFSLEKAIGQHCMRGMFETLEHAAMTEKPEEVQSDCAREVERTLQLDSQDLIAICARDGIDSPSCTQRFSLQVLNQFGNTGASKGSLAAVEMESNLKLAKSLTKIEAAKSQVERAILAWRQKNSDENLDIVKASYNHLIQLTCPTSTLKLVPVNENQWNRALAAVAGPTPAARDSLITDISRLTAKDEKKNSPSSSLNAAPEAPDDIIAKRTKEKQKKNPSASDGASRYFQRIRFIASSCAEVTAAALKVLPNFPAAVCHRDGFYTPSCLRALRQAREEGRMRMIKEQRERALKAAAAHGGTPAPRKDGLSSF